MNLVFLDGFAWDTGDISFAPVEKWGNLTFYPRTSPEEIKDRISDCDGLLTSKCKITAELIKSCPKLKYIGVTATGYDNIDLQAAKEAGVAVYHVPAYSTPAVAQHAFSLLLELAVHVGQYNTSVQNGKWCRCTDFTFIEHKPVLLDGKSIGIIGYGNIGKRVAAIAEAFGMKVNIYSRDKKAAMASDVVTLHCPLTEENKGFINKDFIREMKEGAILINTARGGLINEEDLADALKSGRIAAAGLDVLSSEPPSEDNPLLGLPNCFITPHMAWMPKETKQKAINICGENLKNFLNGDNTNRII